VNIPAALVASPWREVTGAGKVQRMKNPALLPEPTTTPKLRSRKFFGIRLRYWGWFLYATIGWLGVSLWDQVSSDGVTALKNPFMLFSQLTFRDLVTSALFGCGLIASVAYFEKRILLRRGIDADTANDQGIYRSVQSRVLSVAGSAENVQKRVVEALIEHGVLIVKRDDLAGLTVALTPQCWRSFGSRIRVMVTGSDPCQIAIHVAPCFYVLNLMTDYGRSWEHVEALENLITAETYSAASPAIEWTPEALAVAANKPPTIFMVGAWQRLLLFTIVYSPVLLLSFEPGRVWPFATLFVIGICAELFAYLKFRAQVQRNIRTELQELFETVLLNSLAACFLFVGLFSSSKSWLSGENISAIVIMAIFMLLSANRFNQKKRERAQRAVLQAAREKAELERQLSDAKLVALSAQIEPHFLFNTLASIQYLIRNDTSKAGEMTSDLIRYLRLALPRMKQATARLADELDLVRAYLGIMQIRMGARLQFAIDSPDDLGDVPIPTMTLITLVENAIKHGLEQKPDGGMINLIVSKDAQILRLEVADTGGGFSTAASGTGIGLANIRERLKTLYGHRAHLELEANQPSGVKAILIIPTERK
jgi:two-component sensor histidine kinase